MAQAETDIAAAGAEIIWVLEENTAGQIGTAADCREFMDGKGSTRGWCVGDGQTQPSPGTFDESPFSVQRGFDMIVVRESMEVVFTSAHGTPGGNENLSGDELAAQVASIAASL